jgi:hypothetical protein
MRILLAVGKVSWRSDGKPILWSSQEGVEYRRELVALDQSGSHSTMYDFRCSRAATRPGDEDLILYVSLPTGDDR